MQVYLLDIYFSFDNDYRSRSIGCFSTLELAQFHKSKWELFFTTKIKEIINPTLSDEEVIEEDKWETADKWIDNPYYDPDTDPSKLTIDRKNRFYSGRDYFLFGILAGVRWRECPYTISQPKGFPSNSSDEVKEQYKQWGLDAHSASYLTLKELIEHDWDKIIKDDKTNYLSLDNFVSLSDSTVEKMKKLGNPEDVRCVFWFDN